MSWLAAVGTLCIAALVIFGLFAAIQSGTSQEEMLAEFRLINSTMVQTRFGSPVPVAGRKWYRVLANEDQRVVARGRGVLLGLRQTVLLEDERGHHWRVVVATEKGAPPHLVAHELGKVQPYSVDSTE